MRRNGIDRMAEFPHHTRAADDARTTPRGAGKAGTFDPTLETCGELFLNLMVEETCSCYLGAVAGGATGAAAVKSSTRI
jgi:hypothetical protein